MATLVTRCSAPDEPTETVFGWLDEKRPSVVEEKINGLVHISKLL